MKKLILGSAIVAILGVASNAMAAPNNGTVNFIGSVSTATCELSLQDSSGSGVTNINLGTLSTASTGNATAVNFKLVPQTDDCIKKTQADISWTSATLGTSGIDNAAKRNGTNAYVQVKATNATGTGDFIIKKGQSSFGYNVNGGIKSFDYSATLTKPAVALTPGIFTASASYMVTYK